MNIQEERPRTCHRAGLSVWPNEQVERTQRVSLTIPAHVPPVVPRSSVTTRDSEIPLITHWGAWLLRPKTAPERSRSLTLREPRLLGKLCLTTGLELLLSTPS